MTQEDMLIDLPDDNDDNSVKNGNNGNNNDNGIRKEKLGDNVPVRNQMIGYHTGGSTEMTTNNYKAGSGMDDYRCKN